MSKHKTYIFCAICVIVSIVFRNKTIHVTTSEEEVIKVDTTKISSLEDTTLNFKLTESEMEEVMLIYMYRYGDRIMKSITAEDVDKFYGKSSAKIERNEIRMYILYLYIEKYGYGIIINYVESKTKKSKQTFNKHEVKDSACTDKPRDWTPYEECPEDSGINN